MRIEKKSVLGVAMARAQSKEPRFRRRLLITISLLLFSTGPTPGAVGSCNEKDSSLDFVELQSYCEQKEELICVRRGIRGELNEKGVNECRRQATQDCKSRFWSPDCRPTQRQAQACINALKSRETVQTQASEIYECSQEALCRVKTQNSSTQESDAEVER